MSSLNERAEWARRAEGAAPAISPDVIEATPDRRAQRRVVSAYRPGCVFVRGRMLLGVIRNLSKGGVMIELDETIPPGTAVRYFWDETNVIDAVVAWSDGRAHGLDNAEDAHAFDNPFPYRSVRVPCVMRAELWIDGRQQYADIENLSLGGMRVRGLEARRGALLTVRMGSVELCNATVRWIDRDEAGIRFDSPLTRRQLAEVLRALGEEAGLEEHLAAAHRA